MSGWKPERNQYPDSLHCTIMPHHVAAADQLLQDLSEAAQSVKVRTNMFPQNEKANHNFQQGNSFRALGTLHYSRAKTRAQGRVSASMPRGNAEEWGGGSSCLYNDDDGMMVHLGPTAFSRAT